MDEKNGVNNYFCILIMSYFVLTYALIQITLNKKQDKLKPPQN